MNDSQRKALEEARKAADVIQALELPTNTAVILGQGGKVSLFPANADELRQVRRQIGQVDKVDSHAGMVLEGAVAGVLVTVWPPEGTCRQVEVGVEEVEVEEVVTPAETRTVKQTRPILKWECGDVLREADAA